MGSKGGAGEPSPCFPTEKLLSGLGSQAKGRVINGVKII
jgi:hypothetical protein